VLRIVEGGLGESFGLGEAEWFSSGRQEGAFLSDSVVVEIGSDR
jgi:hypothetical protein